MSWCKMIFFSRYAYNTIAQTGTNVARQTIIGKKDELRRARSVLCKNRY